MENGPVNFRPINNIAEDARIFREEVSRQAREARGSDNAREVEREAYQIRAFGANRHADQQSEYRRIAAERHGRGGKRKRKTYRRKSLRRRRKTLRRRR